MDKPLLVSVVGPTAVGKTEFAIHLALHFRSEIVSADSRQFYREMNIGTAKPSKAELARVRHHFIDSHSIDDYYSAGRYGADAVHLLDELFGRLHPVIAVGGSGLFLRALWQGLDEMPKVDPEIRKRLNQEFQAKGLDALLVELAKEDPDYYHQVDRQNPQRVIRALEVLRATHRPFSSFRRQGATAAARNFRNLKLGLNVDREVLFERIDRRMDDMIASGLFEEAERLYPLRSHNALQTVGYQEVFGYLNGDYDRQEAERLLKRNSRRYAKRQLTWFRKDAEIHWLNPDELEKAIELILDMM